jgi:hypothetical protein
MRDDCACMLVAEVKKMGCRSALQKTASTRTLWAFRRTDGSTATGRHGHRVELLLLESHDALLPEMLGNKRFQSPLPPSWTLQRQLHASDHPSHHQSARSHASAAGTDKPIEPLGGFSGLSELPSV